MKMQIGRAGHIAYRGASAYFRQIAVVTLCTVEDSPNVMVTLKNYTQFLREGPKRIPPNGKLNTLITSSFNTSIFVIIII